MVTKKKMLEINDFDEILENIKNATEGYKKYGNKGEKRSIETVVVMSFYLVLFVYILCNCIYNESY